MTRAVLALLGAMLLAHPAQATPRLLVYYESWLDPGSAGLTTLPASLDIVALAFARPDLGYAGGLQLTATGLQFAPDGAPLRAAVLALRRRHPAVRVVLAVGGATYPNWTALDPNAIRRLVQDLGLDGVDLDYEPTHPACHVTQGTTACASDAEWISIVTRMRAALPRPALLTVPGWSVGAYGEGAWAQAEPRSPWTGSMLTLLRSPAGAMIDLVSLMAYDAGPYFDPAKALAAYCAAWPGPVLMGASVADGAGWLHTSPDGAMLYGWLSQAPPGQPSAPMLAAALCRRWHAERGCD